MRGGKAKPLCYVLLPGGRRIGFTEYGQSFAEPVLYCHGFPSSRLEARLLVAASEGLNVRVIAPDRPGYGSSDPSPGRTVGDFADDVVAVLNHLNLDRVGILGVSGGGPYALSFVSRYPERVSRVALVGALGPPSAVLACREGFVPLVRPLWGVARRRPLLLSFLAGLGVRALYWRGRFGIGRRLACPADEEVLADPAVTAILRQAQREGLRQGGAGAAQDLILYVNSWNFPLQAHNVPMSIWHGEADRVVPVEMARQLAQDLPLAELHIVAGEGHYSLPVRYAHAIIESVLCGSL